MFCQSSRRHLECLRSHHQYFSTLLSISYRYQDPTRGQQKRKADLKKKKRLATQRGQYYLSIPRAFLLHNFMTSTRLGSAGQGRTGDCVHHSLSFPSDVGRRRLP